MTCKSESHLDKSVNTLNSISGVTLVEILVVVAIMGILSLILYDLNLSILTSNLLIEVKNDLSSQGQQALNQIKNRLISSRLLLADKYNKSTNTWTGIGSYYIGLLQLATPYLPLPIITPTNINPSGDYCNVIARIESRTVGNQTRLVTLLIPSDPNQPDTGLSATSIGNSILFAETLSPRRIQHVAMNNTIENFIVDTYRLNFYYLYQKNGNEIAGKNYSIGLIQWESEPFVDYAQLYQIIAYLIQQGMGTANTLTNMLDQLRNPSTSPFPEERGKLPLRYAWDITNAALIDITNPSTIASSIRANFYSLIYDTNFTPTNNTSKALISVGSDFIIPQRQVVNLLPGLETGATQGRTPYSIAFNNNSNGGLSNPIPQNIPHLVPIRFNPYDTTSSFPHPKFMGGFEIGIIPNTTVGYQVNLRLVLMADSTILRRMSSQETIVLVATRN
jgi:prepilin-type N-terminal cleavage/methylation domain-containing protein